jgi:hypothetical protein
MLLLNIGPSALALGLIVPMSIDAGFEVCVVGKPEDKDPPKVFRVSVSGPGGRLEYRAVSWWVGAQTVAELPRDLVDRLESQEELLMTGSLRGAIAERHEFMTEVLRRRPAQAETIVLACENAPHGDYDKVRDACARTGALMLGTVVNRMCIEERRDDDRRRMVSVHRLREWLVERPAGAASSRILQALSAVDGFAVVDDIRARHARKLWMVNGAHQALALAARHGGGDHRLQDWLQGGNDELRDALTSGVSAWLGRLHYAMNEALRSAYPSLTDSIEYADKHVRAYSEHSDSVARVLGAFQRLELVPFVDALDERIAAPARICQERGLSLEPFQRVIAIFLELVASIDAFEDNEEVRGTPIDATADIATVERFREMLTPWQGDAADKLTTHFEQLLADHRQAFEA